MYRIADGLCIDEFWKLTRIRKRKLYPHTEFAISKRHLALFWVPGRTRDADEIWDRIGYYIRKSNDEK